MESSEHLNLTSPICRCPPPRCPHPLFPCKGLATDRSRRFSLTSPLFFCSQSWAPEHMPLPTYQYPLSLAVYRTPVSPFRGPSTSIICLGLFSSFLTLLRHPATLTPLHLNPRGAPIEVCPRRLIEDSRAPFPVSTRIQLSNDWIWP